MTELCYTVSADIFQRFPGYVRGVAIAHDVINALVNIGNLVSLRHLVPAGGHAIDVLTGDGVCTGVGWGGSTERGRGVPCPHVVS